MDFHDSLAANLPAPRDDEPGKLRDDILDELADHLACAYRREVMRGADAQTARQRALERFGDPAAVACRLWFDAMKGRIMRQRILVIYSVVLTIFSVGLVGMLLLQSVAAQRLAREALTRAEFERHQAEAAQREMLQKLDAISKAAQSPKSSDWIPVTFKLTRETLDGPPAVGYHASLGKGDRGWNNQEAITRESDDKGMIEFGVVQPGDWGFRLYRFGEGGETWEAHGKLNVLPGTTITKTIICPEPKRVTLTSSVDWPADLANQGLVVLATLGHQGYSYQQALRWNSYGSLLLLERPDPECLLKVREGNYYVWKFAGVATTATIDAGLKPGKTYLDLKRSDPAGGPKPPGDPRDVAVLPGTYSLQQLMVFRPLKEHAANFHGVRSEFIAYSAPPSQQYQLFALAAPPSDESNPLNRENAGGNIMASLTPVPAADSYWRNSPTFKSRKDQPNHWTIRLPDELIKAVREKLKDEKK
jgi:hypothetical protein